MDRRSPARGRSTARLEHGLWRLASQQHGVVARRQLLRLGFGAGAIDGRVHAGRLTVVHQGVYLVGHTARARLATEMAATLACGSDAAVSDRSAAVLLRLVPGEPGRVPVHVTVPRDWAPARKGIRVHRSRSFEARDTGRIERLRVTSPARTIFDLAAECSASELETVYAEAERRHGVAPSALVDQLERNRGRPGAGALRALLERSERPALTRSKAERKLLALLRHSGCPSPAANQRVARYEVDLLWERQRLVVEFDGFEFHSDRGAFERDRRHDAELQARGYRVIRVTWRQLIDDPEAVVDRIRRTLAH